MFMYVWSCLMTTDPQALERNVKGLILYQSKSHGQSGVRQAQEHLNKIHSRDVAIIADIKNNPEALLRYCLLGHFN